jgi:hypothetical protein
MDAEAVEKNQKEKAVVSDGRHRGSSPYGGG